MSDLPRPLPTLRRRTGAGVTTLLATAAGLLIAAAPAPAPAPLTPDAVRAKLAEAQGVASGGDCAAALAIADPLVAQSTGEARTQVQLFRLRCLGAANRTGELPQLARELATAAPTDPIVRRVAVLVAADEHRMADAADLLAGIATNDPAGLAIVPGKLWQQAAQVLTEQKDYARRDRTALALARADWQPADMPDIRDGLAQSGIETLLAESKRDEAAELLPQIAAPEILFDMAIQRRFEPLWPGIADRLGPHGEKSIDRFAGERLDLFANSPQDPRARRDAVRAHLLLGRYADAATIAGQVPIADGMDEDAVTTIRYGAEALSSGGQAKEAVDRLRALSAIDLSRTPSAVSAIVSLAELLDESGRAEEGLAVARDGLGRGANALSPFGKAWLRRTEVCTLSTLGRAAEAKTAGDLLLSGAADNEAAAIEGLLCARREGDAETIAVATLATAEGADRLANQFQPQGAIIGAGPSRLRDLWTGFLARPRVRSAFDRAARILPQPLWPSHVERPVPRARSQPASGPTA